jgi:hypothetical protein
MQLVFDELADEQLTELEQEGDSPRLSALRRCLGALEVRSDDPKLGTRMFSTPSFEHVRATPTGFEDDVVLWTTVDDQTLLIIAMSTRRP